MKSFLTRVEGNASFYNTVLPSYSSGIYMVLSMYRIDAYRVYIVMIMLL